MSISLTTARPCEATVTLDQPNDLRYWCERFQASATQIRIAIEAVGDSAPCVAAWLRESRGTGLVRQDGKWTFLQATVRNLMFFAIGLCGGTLIA